MKKEIDISFSLYSEDGDCFIKCLQEVYFYYKLPLTTSKIMGIINTLDLVYDSNELNQGLIYIDENMKNLDNLPIKVNEVVFEDVERGLQFIKNELLNNRPVILSVNTYYLHYTDDYLKNSGGYFKTGHSIIVYGFDDIDCSFLVCDPTLNIARVSVSFEDMKLAWTYKKDANKFRPLCAYIFIENVELNLKKFLHQKLRENLMKYFVEMDCSERSSLNNIAGFNMWLKDFERVTLSEDISILHKEILENIAYSIFHEIRWSRKSFSLFLKSEEFADINKIDEYVNKFLNFFDRYTYAHNILVAGIYSNNLARIKNAYNEVINIINDEINCINNLLNDLN